MVQDSRSERRQTIAHELVHIALAKRTGGRVPDWLVEGIAMYASGDKRAGDAGALLSGAQLKDASKQKPAEAALSLTKLSKPDALHRMSAIPLSFAYSYSSAAAYAIANEHGGLMLGGDARKILTGDASVSLVLPPKKEPRRRRDRDGGVNPIDDPLFDALRELRRALAQEAGVPPYVVFHDSTLREMAASRPQSLAALGEIGGVGARKLEAYGEAFLDAIRRS